MAALLPASGLSQTSLPPNFSAVSGVDAANVLYRDTSNSQRSLKEFKGQVIILNLWATWCAPCVQELPSLHRLSDQLKNKGVVLVAVSQDKGGSLIAQKFLERIGLSTFQFFADPTGSLYRNLQARGLPTTLIFGRDGKIIARVEGAVDWERTDIVEFLQNAASQ